MTSKDGEFVQWYKKRLDGLRGCKDNETNIHKEIAEAGAQTIDE
jgi:hypothetical protein